ncbi:MAG TPA: cysteine hydrolase [Anaerolineae bacterium]|nr:cysteine hydrolase [Anaerolineae bacterium]
MLTQEELIAKKMARINEVHRFVRGRTALLVIDMQRSFMDPEASLGVAQAWDIVPNIKKLLNFCRENEVLVIYTAFIARPEIPCLRVDPFGPEHRVHDPGQPTGWGLPSSNSVLGTTGPEDPAIIDELKPLPTELVVEGYTLDKFYGTPLDLALRSQDIRYLIFTGSMTDLCLGSTLFSAASRDYRVTAVKDATATIWPEIQECMFDIFTRKLARVINTDETLKELQEIYS